MIWYNLDLNMQEMPSTRAYGFQIWSDGIVEFKHKFLNLPLGKKTNMQVPKLFVKNDDFMVDVIRGIFDTDGCVYLEPKKNGLYPRIEITTISKALAEQLKKSLIKIGFRTTIFVKNMAEKGRNTAYVVCTRGDKMIKNWMKIIRPANQKHTNKFYFYLDNS